jgi:hypothetical protein
MVSNPDSDDRSALRSMRNRRAALIKSARHDPRESTAKARSAFDARFLREVDEQGEFPEPERQRRAAALRRAYFLGLSIKAAEARQRRAQRVSTPHMLDLARRSAKSRATKAEAKSTQSALGGASEIPEAPSPSVIEVAANGIQGDGAEDRRSDR